MRTAGKRAKLVAVGGTFDEFHKGHRTLLQKAFEIGQRVLIGLCTDDFVTRMKKPHRIAPFAVRLEELKSYLRKHDWAERAEVTPLHDAYGPASKDPQIEAIVVSQETAAKALEINEERITKKIPPLEIYVINMVLAENSDPISTTRIRRLEIDREGKLLKK